MLNRLMLLFIASILWISGTTEADKSAQKLLDSFDLEEIIEKLLDFDVDNNGELSELEVELQQPGIQKYLDRYYELLKAEEVDDDEEDEEKTHIKSTTTQQEKESNSKKGDKSPSISPKQLPNPGESIHEGATAPSDTDSYAELQKAEEEEEPEEKTTREPEAESGDSSPPIPHKHLPNPKAAAEGATGAGDTDNVAADEDDGVEIEVVDEMEIVDDEGIESGNFISSPVIFASVAGLLSVVVYVFWTVTKSVQQAKLQQEEKLIQKRDAWLNRLQSSQPRNMATTADCHSQPESQHISLSTRQSSRKASESKGEMCLAASLSTKTSVENSNSSCSSDIAGPPCDEYLGDVSSGQGEPQLQSCSGAVQPTGKAAYPQVIDTDISGEGGTNGPSSLNHSDETRISQDSCFTQRPPSQLPTSNLTVNQDACVGQSKHLSRPQSQAASEESISPECYNTISLPKTADHQKVKAFLEKALDCTLVITDEISRMRLSGGKMRIPSDHFPTTLKDLKNKMQMLLRQAFSRQVNKIKFSISAYNACEVYSSTFHDEMVDLTTTLIRNEAVNTLLTNFSEENQSNDSAETGLWDSFGGGTDTLETYGFLPRLIGSVSDNVNISPSLLSDLLSHDRSATMVSSLLQTMGSRARTVKRLDELLLSEGTTFQAMEVLVANPQFGEALAKLLARETEQAAEQGLGNYFETQAALSGLLSVSTIPENSTGRQNFQPSKAALEPFQSLRSFPHLTADDVTTAQTMIQKGIHHLQNQVYSALRKVVSNKSVREMGLSWLAAIINLNELRTSSVMQDSSLQPVCSDGFMVNLCSVLLEFCLPICQSAEKMEKVDITYSASSSCRLTYNFETCLAGGQIVTENRHQIKPCLLPGELQGKHSFITECFHLTQRLLSVSLIPAIKHYNQMHRQFSAQMTQVKGTDKEEIVKSQHVLVSVVWDTCLLDTELARSVTTFYISQARLLLNTVTVIEQKYKTVEEVHLAQQKALSVIPEFCMKDIAQWFTFLAYSVLRVHPNATKGITLVPFVDSCVMLLERPDLMPGPVPASMIVSALLAFMKDSDKDQRISTSWGSGIMSDLAAMVHTCPSAQTKLGPALLRTYVSVDVVEGLDVDKDTFDKFSSRVQIGQLVEELWSRVDCRTSILNECGSELFQKFLNSILDTLLYMLHDSFSRLANVKKIESLKASDGDWNALSKREQVEKDLFLRNEELVASGFMRQAKKTLKFLTLISQSEPVVQCFTQQPLAARAASAINGFLDSLCGVKAKSFKVKDMAKYEFNPMELLFDIMNIILRIAVEDTSHTDGYLVSMVKDLDFELTHLEKAQSIIISKGIAGDDTVEKVSQLMEQVRLLAAEHSTQSVSSGSDENNWRDAFVDFAVNQEELERQYVSTMQAHRFNEARIQTSHYFCNNMQGSLDPRGLKVKALMKEIKQLATSLPVNAGASIFVRQDKDRMDVMRAVVTGPAGTPYSLGCFCFDVYFPSSYPNVPPLVKIITTGNGTVRFNPNLYADGKVCLSLLGTWHAGDASEKWTPNKSSLYQVLVSIQSMILTPDPVFNEPGYERIKGTEEGKIQSMQYNWKLHLQTLRHAILGQLRNPPQGFELVIRQHFALQREVVLKQCAEWVEGCKDPDLLKRLRQVADCIFEELMSLEVDFSMEEESSCEEEEED